MACGRQMNVASAARVDKTAAASYPVSGRRISGAARRLVASRVGLSVQPAPQGAPPCGPRPGRGMGGLRQAPSRARPRLGSAPRSQLAAVPRRARLVPLGAGCQAGGRQAGRGAVQQASPISPAGCKATCYGAFGLHHARRSGCLGGAGQKTRQALLLLPSSVVRSPYRVSFAVITVIQQVCATCKGWQTTQRIGPLKCSHSQQHRTPGSVPPLDAAVGVILELISIGVQIRTAPARPAGARAARWRGPAHSSQQAGQLSRVSGCMCWAFLLPIPQEAHVRRPLATHSQGGRAT
jgi:hypothetical protein